MPAIILSQRPPAPHKESEKRGAFWRMFFWSTLFLGFTGTFGSIAAFGAYGAPFWIPVGGVLTTLAASFAKWRQRVHEESELPKSWHKPPHTGVFMTPAHKGNGSGLFSGCWVLAMLVAVISLFGAFGTVMENGDKRTFFNCLLLAFTSPSLFYSLRYVILGISRKWRGKGRQTNREWLGWLEQAQLAQAVDQLPLLDGGSLAQACLAASLPKKGRAHQYEFSEPFDASQFCTRHRSLIVQRLRSSFSDQQGERRLAIGILETDEGNCLLLFRQISESCALFFAIAHRRNGTVVNLITQRWALYNRDAAPQEGRKKSDEEIAAKRGVPDKEKWRARPEWGALGYWHLVDCICHKLGGDGETSSPQTSASDSELDYYEKIVHVETVKDSKQKQPLPPTHTQVPRSGSDAASSPGVDFL